MSESLKAKTVKGVGWSFADNLANYGITFLVGLVLARLLTPSEYGMLATIMIFIAVANSIVDSGFSNALIRKIDARSVDYNTVFYFNLVVSVLLYGLLYIGAPWISDFFHEPLLVDVTRVVGVVLLINALAIIQRTLFVRDIDFKTQTKVSLIASLSSGAVGIGMAYGGYGVWSLVGQQIVRQLMNTVFLWFYSKWRPAWEFSRESFRELFAFGSKLMVSGLIDMIWKNIYYFVIGRFYTTATLGQYTRAEQFNTIFSSNLTAVVQRVSYPVLSSIQEDSERLKQAYRRVIKTTMLVTFACMLGLAAVARPLILILIGEKWLPAVTYLQILCFGGMLYPLHAINLNILQVKGRSDLFLRLEIIKKVIGIAPIALGIFYGIEYMLCGSVVTSVIAYFLNSYYSAELIHYPTWAQVRDILPALLVSLGVALVMWGISFLDCSVWVLLPLQCVCGILLAMFVYGRLQLEEYLEIKQIGLSLLNRCYKHG